MVEKLLEVRKLIKSKKPTFIRQDAGRHLKLGTSWRARKGRHNKLRMYRRGKMPTPSYSSPSKTKGLHASGKREVMIYKVSDIDSVDKDTEAARISSAVGIKKRIDIIKHAEKLKIRVLNPGLAVLKAMKAAVNKKKAEDKKKEKTENKTVEKKKLE